MIKVLLADDQALIREGIKHILDQDAEIRVTGLAGNGNEALAICDQLVPDLILMDIKMPGCDGVEATRLIKEKHAEIKIIVLTTFDDDASISKALESGADGYVLKDISPDELLMAIKGTMKGLRIIHQNVYDTVLKRLTSGIRLSGAADAENGLSRRELEIIRLIVLGKSNREIGAALNLSEGRIKSLLTVILKKFQLKDRMQLALYAVKNHLI